MANTTTANPTKVVTGKVRFSYVKVFKAEAMEEGETPKFSICLLIPKKDKVTLAKIEAAVKAATEQGKNSKYGGKIPANLKLPLRDGDEEKPDREEFAGMMFLNASSLKRPGVLDENGDEFVDESDFYSGCYGRASVNFFPFAGKAKGVAVGLNGVKKTEDGEDLTGGRFDSSDFDDDDLV